MVKDSDIRPHPRVNVTLDLNHCFGLIDFDRTRGAFHTQADVPRLGLLREAVDVVCHRITVEEFEWLSYLGASNARNEHACFLVYLDGFGGNGKDTIS